MSKTQPFTYFGSKYQSFSFINDKLPRTHQYVEPFGGSGTVLLNRDPVPVETYNDLYGDLPHFFRVLRDHPDELLDKLQKTPYSREEHQHALTQRERGYPGCDDIERARLIYVALQQAYSQRQFLNGDTWSYDVAHSNWVPNYRSKIEDQLPKIANRLLDVQIESKPALDVMKRYDDSDTLFYIDPPYPHEIRNRSDNYAVEMSDDEHREMIELAKSLDGYVLLSGYACELYADLLDAWNLYVDNERIVGRDRRTVGEFDTRQEVVWTNYDADELGGMKIGDWSDPAGSGKQLTLTGAVE